MVFSEYSDFLTNKSDRHDIIEILLKVAVDTIEPTKLRQEIDSDDGYETIQQKRWFQFSRCDKNVYIKFSAHNAFLE